MYEFGNILLHMYVMYAKPFYFFVLTNDVDPTVFARPVGAGKAGIPWEDRIIYFLIESALLAG